MNIVLGISFTLYSDTSFFTIQPMYLFELGFTKVNYTKYKGSILIIAIIFKIAFQTEINSLRPSPISHIRSIFPFFPQPDTALIIAIGAAADLGSRCILAVMSLFVQVKARYVYLAGAIFTIVSRFGKKLANGYSNRLMLFSSVSVFLGIFDFTGMAIITGVMGFFRTWIHVPMPLVFAEYLPQERYSFTLIFPLKYLKKQKTKKTPTNWYFLLDFHLATGSSCSYKETSLSSLAHLLGGFAM